jgi:hypothetical protein
MNVGQYVDSQLTLPDAGEQLRFLATFSPGKETSILIHLGAGWVCGPAGTRSRRDEYLAIGLTRTAIFQSPSRWPVHGVN